jgi:predicted NAD/FAD-dependent oxidoreductase
MAHSSGSFARLDALKGPGDVGVGLAGMTTSVGVRVGGITVAVEVGRRMGLGVRVAKRVGYRCAWWFGNLWRGSTFLGARSAVQKANKD